MATLSAGFIFDILRILSVSEKPLSATEISRKLKMPLTTTYRGITTLEVAGYAERHQSSNLYTIGHVGRLLAQRFLSRFALRDLAMPYLRRLTTLTGDTASLFVRIGWYYVRVSFVRGTNEIIQTGPLGEVRDLDDGAAGKVIMARLPAAMRARYFSEFKPQMTSVEKQRLTREFDRIQATGFAVEPSSTSAGRLAPAFVIASPSDTIFGSIGIEGGILDKNRRADEMEQVMLCIGELTTLCTAAPEKCSNRYDHLPASEILLPSVTIR